MKTVEEIEKTVKVVIIEDYKLTRIELRLSLNKYKSIKVVGESDNALDGIELIKDLKPDIVLMDLGLPNINGIEAIQKVKEIRPKTKVIVLTSHEEKQEVLNAFRNGASAYCIKDIDTNTLATVIKNVSKGVCWIDSAVADVAMELFAKTGDEHFSANYTKLKTTTRLTERESQVLELLVKGLKNKEIADELFISEHTAKAHVGKIIQKFSAIDRVDVAVKAVRERLV